MKFCLLTGIRFYIYSISYCAGISNKQFDCTIKTIKLINDIQIKIQKTESI